MNFLCTAAILNFHVRCKRLRVMTMKKPLTADANATFTVFSLSVLSCVSFSRAVNPAWQAERRKSGGTEVGAGLFLLYEGAVIVPGQDRHSENIARLPAHQMTNEKECCPKKNG